MLSIDHSGGSVIATVLCGEGMGSKRSKRNAPKLEPEERVFADLSLDPNDFEVESGGGKSFLSKQRIVWMKIRDKRTGKIAQDKIGTTKRGFDQQELLLLRELLQELKNKRH